MLKLRDVLAWFGAAAFGGLVVAILGGASQKTDPITASEFVLKQNGHVAARLCTVGDHPCIAFYNKSNQSGSNQPANIAASDLKIYIDEDGNGWIVLRGSGKEAASIRLSTKNDGGLSIESKSNSSILTTSINSKKIAIEEVNRSIGDPKVIFHAP